MKKFEKWIEIIGPIVSFLPSVITTIECLKEKKILMPLILISAVCLIVGFDIYALYFGGKKLKTEILETVGQNSNFDCITETVSIRLEKYLQENYSRIEEIHIICYGRNGYDSIVRRIIETPQWNMKVKIIVYNPEFYPDICRWELSHDQIKGNAGGGWLNVDDRDIRKTIKEWRKSKNNEVTVIATKIPPMMRAAVVYEKIGRIKSGGASSKENKLKAVWGSMQSYRFALNANNEHKLSIEKPEYSLICVCEETKTVKADFDLLINCFEEEFERLSKIENSYDVKFQNGEVAFVDREAKLMAREK